MHLILKNKILICELNSKAKVFFDSNSERILKAFSNACNLKCEVILMNNVINFIKKLR